MPTIDDVIGDALAEIRVARAGDVINAEDMDLGLRTLNRMLDFMNAEGRACYVNSFQDFTFTPALSPHTIGPAGSKAGATNPSFITARRPQGLLFASVNLGGTPAAYRPITVRDASWYANQPAPGVSSSVPTDVYLATEWHDPNANGLAYGDLYFYGIPSVAYGCRLWMRVDFAAVALGATFSLPPGYQHAITMTLAEWLADPFGQSVSASLERKARQARAVVWAENIVIPRARPKDVTMPGSQTRSSGFNYLNRTTR